MLLSWKNVTPKNQGWKRIWNAVAPSDGATYEVICGRRDFRPEGRKLWYAWREKVWLGSYDTSDEAKAFCEEWEKTKIVIDSSSPIK